MKKLGEDLRPVPRQDALQSFKQCTSLQELADSLVKPGFSPQQRGLAHALIGLLVQSFMSTWQEQRADQDTDSKVVSFKPYIMYELSHEVISQALAEYNDSYDLIQKYFLQIPISLGVCVSYEEEDQIYYRFDPTFIGILCQLGQNQDA